MAEKGQSLVSNLVRDVFKGLEIPIFFVDVFELNVVLGVSDRGFVPASFFDNVPDSDLNQQDKSGVNGNAVPNVLFLWGIFGDKCVSESSCYAFHGFFHENDVEVVVGIEVLDELKVGEEGFIA